MPPSSKPARADGGDWVLSGQKIYSTGAHAKDDTMIVAARINPNAPKHQGIILFLVPHDPPR